MVIDRLSRGTELLPCCYFVVEEVACLESIVDRIVQFIDLQLIILYQVVIGFSGK